MDQVFKRVVLANDHGGFALRDCVLSVLKKQGFAVTDLGVYTETSVDYPDMALAATKEFLQGGYDFGVLLCGTGIGISIAANKVAGIRCALLHDSFSAALARRHNNANFIALGGRVRYTEPVEDMLLAYINAQFEGGRHARRLQKIANIE